MTARSKVINPGQAQDSNGADFEDVVIGSTDMINLANEIKHTNKRAVLIYKAMGYKDWEIANMLMLSERTIERYMDWIRKYLKKVS